MKKILTSLCLLFAGASSYAQSSIANGAICPNMTITDTKGVAHNLYTECNAGHYVLIDFYAYWCGPCMATAPIIDEFYKKYGCNSGNVIVLGNECDPAGTLANLHSFDASAGLDTNNTYPTTYGIIGGGTNGTTYGISAYPTIILVGPDKKMINNDIWPISTIANIEAKFPTGVLTPKACAAPAAVNSINGVQINVAVTPNPVQNMLSVQSTNITDIVIYNQLGSKVVSFNTLNNIDYKTIDMSDFAGGIYFVEVTTTKGKGISRVTKN